MPDGNIVSQIQGTYPDASAGTAAARDAIQANIESLLALVPDPDVPPGTGGRFLFGRMEPGAAAQLRLELAALRDSITA